jgi:hypothetical protein
MVLNPYLMSALTTHTYSNQREKEKKRKEKKRKETKKRNSNK